jgi:putative NIF3 family GTP cyclohydrolase 1 type 2
MRAYAVHEHFHRLGTWVNWHDSVDGFHFGDPDAEVRGIAVGWKPYWADLRRAAELGCTLFVGHEPIFREGRKGDESSAATPPEHPKLAWLRESGLTVYRCHDVWDLIPQVGVRDSWAKGLGFEGEPLAVDGYHRIEDVSGSTFGELCMRILARVTDVGQSVVLADGDGRAPVSRLALGTGAAWDIERMLELGADVCLLCDDYFRFVRDGAMLRDASVPFLLVNHASAEEWAMRSLHQHLREAFPETPVHFMAQGCAYRAVLAPAPSPYSTSCVA